MDQGGKVKFCDNHVQYGYEHEWMDAASPFSPQGQLPFPSSYSLSRSHTSCTDSSTQTLSGILMCMSSQCTTSVPSCEREVEAGRGGERGRRNWRGMDRKMEDYDGHPTTECINTHVSRTQMSTPLPLAEMLEHKKKYVSSNCNTS